MNSLLKAGLVLLMLAAIAGCSKEQLPPFGSADLLLAATPKGMTVTGMEGPESSPEGSWRWVVGPAVTLTFRLDEAREYVLRYAMNNPLPGQRIELKINGDSQAVHDALKPDPWLKPSASGVVRFKARKGLNTLEWTFSIQNHVGGVFAEADKRPLSQALLECRLYPAPASPK